MIRGLSGGVSANITAPGDVPRVSCPIGPYSCPPLCAVLGAVAFGYRALSLEIARRPTPLKSDFQMPGLQLAPTVGAQPDNPLVDVVTPSQSPRPSPTLKTGQCPVSPQHPPLLQ